MSLPAADDSSAAFGRYRLLERIGAGGMAIVYRALAVASDGNSRELVIKRLLPELCRDRQFSSMLVAEARISARLRHPNIVQVYELGRVGDEFYLAMELVDGVDLVRMLNGCIHAKRQLPIGASCHVAVELARALAYAHDLRDNENRPLAIVHRDVTPSNVMVTRQGAVKLLDFGVAKAAEHVRDERTRTGTLKGKVNYLSPESADGMPVDRRADIFALGIVLHECLTLKRLFKADGDLQTLRLIREAKVAPPSATRAEVTPELDRVILKMLARDPDARYADCHELVADLEPLARALGGDAAGLARLVAELPAAPEPVAVAEEMDAGPTPAVEVHHLFAESGVIVTPSVIVAPSALAAASDVPAPIAAAAAALAGVDAPRRRPRWFWPALAGALALPVLAIAFVVVPHGKKPPPPAPVAAPAPVVVATPVAPVAAPAPGVIVVETDVAAARITLDGQVVADHVARARITVAHAGPHELGITATRRRPLTRTLTIAAGATVAVRVKMERAHGHGAKPARGENYLVNPFGH